MRRLRRASALGALALLLGLGLAACDPASALSDDIGALEDSLSGQGFANPYVEFEFARNGAGRGIVFLVLFDSASTSEQDWRTEAGRVGQLIWTEARYRVLSVSVSSQVGVPWLDGDLPPVVSRTSGELQRQYGPRSPALDARGEGDRSGENPNGAPSGGSDGSLVDGRVVAGVAGALGLLLVGGTVLIVVLVRRSRRRDAVPPMAWAAVGPYAGPSWWSPPGAAPPGHGPPGTAPPGHGPPGHPPHDHVPPDHPPPGTTPPGHRPPGTTLPYPGAEPAGNLPPYPGPGSRPGPADDPWAPPTGGPP